LQKIKDDAMRNKNKINHELNLKFDILPRHIRHWASHLQYITGVAIEIIIVTLLAFLGLAVRFVLCSVKEQAAIPSGLIPAAAQDLAVENQQYSDC
jgi:hypothetical protein